MKLLDKQPVREGYKLRRWIPQLRNKIVEGECRRMTVLLRSTGVLGIKSRLPVGRIHQLSGCQHQGCSSSVPLWRLSPLWSHHWKIELKLGRGKQLLVYVGRVTHFRTSCTSAP